MPVRRPSIAGSPGHFGSPSVRLRSDLANDSSSDLNGTSMRPEVNMGEQKVMSTLVGRLVNRLPCNSGARLVTVESDGTVNATVESLLQLSKTRFQGVIYGLIAALDSLSRHANSVQQSEIPLEILQSQAYMLHILLLCLTQNWRLQVESKPIQPSDLPRCWPDPAPLEDGLARHLLGTTMALFRLAPADTMSSPGNTSPTQTRDPRGFGTASSSTYSRQATSSSSSSSKTLRPAFFRHHSIPPRSTVPTPEPVRENLSSLCDSSQSTTRHIISSVAAIIWYLSASNWPTIFGRVKSRIKYLTTASEEHPDAVELRLVDWSNCNRSRLAQVISEISSSFPSIKRPAAQVAVASSLRKAIWNWIDAHPLDYQELVQSNRRLDLGNGNAEALFEALQSISEPSLTSAARRTRVFYPLIVMLLVVCPDSFKKIMSGDMAIRGSTVLRKARAFLESLRRGLSTSKGFEACLVSCSDLSRAAAYLPPNLEGSGARTFVSEIQNDFKAALLNSPHRDELGDPDVIVDGLMALFHLEPATMSSQILPYLLNDSSSINKMTAIKAITLIIEQGDLFPWSSSLSRLRRDIASPLQAILRAQVKMTNGDGGEASRPNRPRPGLDLPASQTNLLLELLALYAADPQLIVTRGFDASDDPAQILRMVSSLMVNPSSAQIRSASAKLNCAVLNFLAGSGASASEDQETAVFVAACSDWLWTMFGDAYRHLLFAFQSLDLIDINDAFMTARDMSLALLQVVERHPSIMAGSKAGEHACLIAYVACMSGLVTPDFENVVLVNPAISAISKLTLVTHRQPRIRQGQEQPSNGQLPASIVHRVKIMDEISSLPPSAGRQQHQRLMRKIIKAFATPSTDGTSVWINLASIAKSMTAKIIAADADSTIDRSRRRNLAADIDGLDEGQGKLWQNTVMYMCAIAETCLYIETPPPTISDTVGKVLLPQVFDDPPDPRLACEAFIKQCMDLLISPSIHVRETLKEALGSELPISWARAVTNQMSKTLSHCIDASGASVSETFTLFVDQILTILRSMTDRIGQKDNSSTSFDLGELVSLLAQYTQRLGKDVPSLRLKMRFCQLCETIMLNRDTIRLPHEGTLRNTLLELFTEWSSETNWETEFRLGAVAEQSKIQRDLEIACLRAMVPVTDGLVIKPSGGDAEISQATVKSRLFYRYYHHLVRVLERANAAETFADDHNPSASGLLTEDRINLAIQSLSHLLASNLDVGLQHCMALGYREDPKLRLVFMQLTAKMLRQGSFGGLNTKRVSSTPKAYLGALTAHTSNLALLVAICEACQPADIDEVSKLLFRVFEAKGDILSLVKVLSEREVAMTHHEPDLFRANSLTTRILTLYAKTYGYNYLRFTLQPLIASLAEKPGETSFELDPSRVGPGEDVTRNADHLQALCQASVDLICASTPQVPVMLRALCDHLWHVVEEKFPDSRHSVVGCFIFLRFFCPAIVSPESVDIDLPEGKDIRRALLLMTKVIQNLASNVMFGSKEPHMKVLNDFLGDNILQVTKFLSDCAVKPRSWEVLAAVKAYRDEAEQNQDAEGDEAILHRFVHKNLAKIESSLEAMPPSYRRGSNSRFTTARGDLDGKAALKLLRQIVDETGPPKNVGLLSPAARAQAYETFMKHNSGRSTESVSTAFYEGPTSSNGRRLFYVDVAHMGFMDYDLLAYHVLQSLHDVHAPFDVVIDLTEFSPSTEVPMTWFKRSIQMCPSSILGQVHTIALYSPTSYAHKRMKRIISEILLVSPPFGKHLAAVCSLGELAEVIPYTAIALPHSTMELAFEPEHVFTGLLRVSDHERQIPVILRLDQVYAQVASWRKQEITSSGVKGFVMDVIRLADVTDILNESTGAGDQMTIRYGQNKSVIVVGKKRPDIVQLIRAKRARLREGPSPDRRVYPSDAPGTLLNVALLNLCSDDDVLRLGAYNLVTELAYFYKYDIGALNVSVSAGLNIPGNSLTFVGELSKSLASSASHITLEFVKDWGIAFGKVDLPQKVAGLQYIEPWLANLGAFARPTREDGADNIKHVEGIIRSFINMTVNERRRLHLLVQTRIWSTLAAGNETLIELVIGELIRMAIDSGMGSEKAECAAEIMVSLASTVVRGKVISRLRKTIAQTYLKPSATLSSNVAWSEICVLARMLLRLSFDTQSTVDIQLFLPEVVHIISLLLGVGSLLMRQTAYGITMNTLQSLIAIPPSGDMDPAMLQDLLRQLQQPKLIRSFGLAPSSQALALSGLGEKELEESLLDSVEEMACFLCEMLAASAVSMDCTNSWRARWISLVAATCFQHNPATQPQAFTVLGHLTCDEVDDDLVYQILVAMGSTLQQLTEADNILMVSMLRCLAQVIPGLMEGSRYAHSLFWLAVAVLQMGYIPLFGGALELLLSALRSVEPSIVDSSLMEVLLQGRSESEESSVKLDDFSGVSFETDFSFSIVAIILKGVRHPTTRKVAIETLTEFLRIACLPSGKEADDVKRKAVRSQGVAFFMALLPSVTGSQEGLSDVWTAAMLEGTPRITELAGLDVLSMLVLPDNSSALLLITLAISLLSLASSETEKMIQYRFLAEASGEMPEVMAMIYDSLIPRMTAALATTPSIPILDAVTLIMKRAMTTPNYSFPSNIVPSESTSSLALHQQGYSQSIGSAPSLHQAARDQLLDDLGMRGLGELTFSGIKIDRVAPMAKWVAGVIESFTI